MRIVLGEGSCGIAAGASKVRAALEALITPQDTCSLASTGWQPYGPELLGGPVEPTDDPVMEVNGTVRVRK